MLRFVFVYDTRFADALIKDRIFKVDIFLKNLGPYNFEPWTVYFPLMTVYFEPMDVYFVKTVFLQGPYFNYSGPYILQYNRHGHIFLDFREFYRILHFFRFPSPRHVYPKTSCPCHIHDRGVDMDIGVYLVRVYVHLTLLCI